MKYTKNSLSQAMASVRRGHLTISKAAQEFGIPRTNLHDHCKNPDLVSKKGPAKQLTEEETQGLINFALYCAGQRMPLTRDQARLYIQEIVRRSGRNLFG